MTHVTELLFDTPQVSKVTAPRQAARAIGQRFSDDTLATLTIIYLVTIAVLAIPTIFLPILTAVWAVVG